MTDTDSPMKLDAFDTADYYDYGERGERMTGVNMNNPMQDNLSAAGS